MNFKRKINLIIGLTLSLFLCSNLNWAQVRNGYPEWPMILRHHTNVVASPNSAQVPVANQLVDFKPNFLNSIPSPATVSNIANQTSFNFGSSGAGFDVCGNMIFYVGHTGLYANQGTNPSAKQLKIYLANGVELTNSSTRLNCSPRDNEVQIATIPGYNNRWIIIYNKNSNDDNQGNYKYDEVYYSIFEIQNGNLTFINNLQDRDLNNNKLYDYGKALSTINSYSSGEGAPVPCRYLYLKRDANNSSLAINSSSIVVDQFIITQNGIVMANSNTPIVHQSPIIYKGFSGNQEDVSTAIELNEMPDDIKLATVFYFREGSNVALLKFNNHEDFGTLITPEVIHLKYCALVPSDQPDAYFNYNTNNWQVNNQNPYYKSLSDFPNTYLTKFANKIAYIEFSPLGKYLYIGHGGYYLPNYSNITYLGQVDIQAKVPVGTSTNNYLEYPIRLMVQEVAGFNLLNSDYLTSGKASFFAGAYSYSYTNWNGVGTIEKAANNKLYFTKFNSNKLFCLDNPDVPFSNTSLLPTDILSSNPNNITLNGTVSAPYLDAPSLSSTQADALFIPDAVDQEEYGTYLNCPTVQIPCENCIGSFAPTKDKKYIISLWASEDGNAGGKTTFNLPEVFIDFPNSTLPSIGPLKPKGAIIDGWQRIEEEFYLPPNLDYTHVSIRLNCATGNCYFDDIRVFPFDGSMKTYVYDPITLRLSAELDERNYATLYEYDEEGKLIRVKKETEKGIMTIKENKNSTVKKP